MDLRHQSLLDHHCHALRREPAPLDAAGFRRHFTESGYPALLPHLGSSVFYRRAVRELAALLECDATEAAVLSARQRAGPEAHAARLLAAAGIEAVLVDTGFREAESYSVPELRALLPCRVEPILRLETLIEGLLREADSLRGLEERFRGRVAGARAEGYVALKSIAAYRGGLKIDPEPEPGEVRAAWERARIGAQQPGWRLTERPLLDHLFLAALEIAVREELPVQLHVGFGDEDADLRLASPLHLRPLLRAQHGWGAPLVLLHCWPFAREAGYLAGIYPHVYADLSLTFPFCAHGGEAAVLAVLEQAPASKVLLATDASGIPELFYLGALFLREGVGAALSRLVAGGWLSQCEAEETAAALFRENAVRLYGPGG